MPQLELHIIGMKSSEFDIVPEGVTCYGYLDKNNAMGKVKYYDLMHSAKAMVNHTANWGGYSSIIEGMYYGCPILVSKYDDFVSEFGEEIDFGYYTNNDTLLNDLRRVFNCSDYTSLCLNAHNRVKDYTWDGYIDEFIHTVNSHLKLKL